MTLAPAFGTKPRTFDPYEEDPLTLHGITWTDRAKKLTESERELLRAVASLEGMKHPKSAVDYAVSRRVDRPDDVHARLLQAHGRAFAAARDAERDAASLTRELNDLWAARKAAEDANRAANEERIKERTAASRRAWAWLDDRPKNPMDAVKEGDATGPPRPHATAFDIYPSLAERGRLMPSGPIFITCPGVHTGPCFKCGFAGPPVPGGCICGATAVSKP